MAGKGPGSRNIEDYTEEFVKAVAAKTPSPAPPSLDVAVNVLDAKIKNAYNGLETSTFTVCSRIRPKLPMDGDGSFACIVPGAITTDKAASDYTESTLVLTPKVSIMGKATLEPLSLDFDYTFGPETQEADLFKKVGAPLVERALEGQVCVVFAYGQTGSGKTHTMSNLMDSLVESIYANEGGRERDVTFSYLEIAGQVCTDCLDPAAKTGDVRVGELLDGRVEIRNLREVACPTSADFTAQVGEAKSRRATESTEKNLESSRSHGIGIVKIGPKKSSSDSGGGEGPQQMAGVMYIIDLAGSERMSDSKNHSDQRMEETKAINLSLMSLKECIRARTMAGLGDGVTQVHVPYRRSKLTLLMKDVFDISCKRLCSTVVLAHVSPLASDVKHSTSTLQYAAPLRVAARKKPAGKKYEKDTRDPALWSHAQVQEWIVATVPAPAPAALDAGCLLAATEGGLALCMLSEAAFHARVQSAFTGDKEAGSTAAHALYGALWTLICDAKVRRRRPDGTIITLEDEMKEKAETDRKMAEKAAVWAEREKHMKSDLVGYDGKPVA